MNIPAIETRYNGVLFRSRMEARFAIAFDVLGIPWQYEFEKFDTSAGRYIPDFFLPTLGHGFSKDFRPDGLFVEAKGTVPTPAEITKASEVMADTGRDVVIFTEIAPRGSLFPFANSIRDKQIPVAIVQCPFCGLIGHTYQEEPGPAEIHSHICWPKEDIARQADILDYFDQEIRPGCTSPLIDLAFEAARSARFEDSLGRNQIALAIEKGRAFRAARIFCHPQITENITRVVAEWSAAEKPFMRYRAPWWVQHRVDMENGVSPCTCYSCAVDRKRPGS